MGLFDFFKKKQKEEIIDTVEEFKEETEKLSLFYIFITICTNY